MAKHRQNKGTKKHVKNRPRKVNVLPTDSGLHYGSLVVAVGAGGGVLWPLLSLSSVPFCAVSGGWRLAMGSLPLLKVDPWSRC